MCWAAYIFNDVTVFLESGLGANGAGAMQDVATSAAKQLSLHEVQTVLSSNVAQALAGLYTNGLTGLKESKTLVNDKLFKVRFKLPYLFQIICC